MIQSFGDAGTEELFITGRATRLPKAIWKRALRKLEQIHAAARLDDLKVPPGNRLHALKADRAGQHSIRINDQWRVCFIFKDADAFDVQICDYH